MAPAVNQQVSYPTSVPDLTWVPEERAYLVLSDAGLVQGNRYETPSDVIIAGRVVRTAPAIGTPTTSGSAVDIYVSTGPQTATLVQPAPGQPRGEDDVEDN